MDLRSNVEASIRGTAPTANLHLKIQVENGVAIPEGVVRDLNQADDVAELAAKVKGITGVDRSGLRLEFAGGERRRARLARRRTLFELPQYASSSMKVAVESGVVTLTGAIKNAAWRGEIRRLCGGIEGVVDVVDRLETPETPDARIQKALDGVFGVRVVPRFPGRVHADCQGRRGDARRPRAAPLRQASRRARRPGHQRRPPRRQPARARLGARRSG